VTRTGTVARRYAKALWALAPAPAGDREALGDELERFVESLAVHPVLGEVLTRPWIKGSDKRAIVDAVAERAGVLLLARRFLGLLAEKNRIDILTEILSAYRVLLDEEAGRVRAEIRTAFPLGPGERSRLAQGLGRAVGRTVMLEEVADPELLAGFRAQIGSLVLDTSVRGQIESMRERLTARV